MEEEIRGLVNRYLLDTTYTHADAINDFLKLHNVSMSQVPNIDLRQLKKQLREVDHALSDLNDWTYTPTATTN